MRFFQDEEEDFFKKFQKEMEKAFERTMPLMKELEKMPAMPLTDISEKEDKIVIKLDMPGIKKEDIDLIATENSIEIKAQRQELKEEKKEHFYNRERSMRSYYRSLPMPKGIDPKTIKAEYENGVLTLTVKKIPEKKKKQLKIKIK